MNAQPADLSRDPALIHLEAVFARQAAAFEQDRNPGLPERLERLRRLRAVVADHRSQIISAVNADFGSRAEEESRLAETGATLTTIDYTIARLSRWMKPRRRGTSIWFLPASNAIVPQPLGVVGVMSPWNYPVNLALAPLATALAAGNRVMVKMSEFTPATTELMRSLVAAAFDDSEVAIIGGEADVATAFSALPFDHLLFTGSTAVGRRVMMSAARNLTPVTLELGGKSPVIVDQDYPVDEAAHRVLWGKTTNAGQTCVAPDYVLLPKGRIRGYVDATRQHYRAHFPQGATDASYTSVINERQYQRLSAIVADARERGCEVVELETVTDAHRLARKFPLTLVINPPADSRVMQEELFGPVMPLLEYDRFEEALALINGGDNPLAIYYFGHTAARRRAVLRDTLSGSAAVNEVVAQFLQVDLPFGGVGASGFGRYHGAEGFDTFSHLKPIFTQRGLGRFTGLKLLYPPYSRLAHQLIAMMKG